LTSNLMDPPRPVRERSSNSESLPGDRLRREMAAVRLSFVWFGTRKTLTREQKAEAADAFGAEGEFLSAGKKLLDTRHSAFKAVTAIRGRIISSWKGMTIPFPESGIRLLPRNRIESFSRLLDELRQELAEAVAQLDGHYSELKRAAQGRLGRLYNSADYPVSLEGLFEVAWDYPSIEPPEYLRQLSPQLYEEECRRVSARFEEAVQLAETAFIDELSKMIGHLNERLTGSEDGKPKIFRDSAIENLQEFFTRFRELNVRSNEQLDGLVSQCQKIVSGVQPQALRDDASIRSRISGQLSTVSASLEDLMVDRPRRNLLRRPAEAS
jgi:hypothetical protein